MFTFITASFLRYACNNIYSHVMQACVISNVSCVPVYLYHVLVLYMHVLYNIAWHFFHGIHSVN